MTRLRRANAEAVRAAIANTFLGSAPLVTDVGRVHLLPHQRDAVVRLRKLLERHMGAVLADEVGLGKTYVALALMMEARRPVVVAPAALRATWAGAMQRAAVSAPFVSYERLSRGEPPPDGCDLVVLDEAHHVRNPATRRYRSVARLARGTRVLMLTATPIHNSVHDLRALIALCIGSAAVSLDGSALRAYVVRRERHDLAGAAPVPALRSPEWIRIQDDSALLEDILNLPPPVPPRGGADGGVLLTLTLVRLWASSRAALEHSLRLRLSHAIAMAQALAAGRHPDRRELQAWTGDANAVQLVLAEMLGCESQSVSTAGELGDSLERHAAAVRALLQRIARNRRADERRAAELERVRQRHPGEQIVAFTQYAETVRSLFRALRHSPGVCALTARGAVVAGGPITRRQALEAFAPRALGVPPPPAAEGITLLIATDLLSEGINLQDASVVVHVDLPWTVARLEQRVGRVRRLGSLHKQVSVYAFAPPTSTAALLGAERRLREKMAAAGRTLGVEDRLLPPDLSAGCSAAPLAGEERLRRRLDRWRNVVEPAPPPAVAAVHSGQAGWLAAVSIVGERLLVGRAGGRFVIEPGELDTLAAGAEGLDAAVAGAMLSSALRSLRRWLARQVAARAAGLASPQTGAGRHAARRTASVLAKAPLHERAELASLASAAREPLDSPIGLAEEQDLLLLIRSTPGPELLRAITRWNEGRSRAEAVSSADSSDPRLHALLLLTA